MSNTEIVRRGYEAWSEGGVEAVLPLLDPEIVVEEIASAPGAETFHGRDGFRALFDKWLGAFEHIAFEPQELIDHGDQVIAVVLARGRGLGSGAEVELRLAHVWTLRDGFAVKVSGYNTREDALLAVGIS